MCDTNPPISSEIFVACPVSYSCGIFCAAREISSGVISDKLNKAKTRELYTAH